MCLNINIVYSICQKGLEKIALYIQKFVKISDSPSEACYNRENLLVK